MSYKNKAEIREELANRLSFLFGEHANIGMAIDFIEQFLDEQLEKKEEEVIEKINTEVTEMHKNMYEEMEKANHQDQYLNGVVRGITVVGRYLNVLKTQPKK